MYYGVSQGVVQLNRFVPSTSSLSFLAQTEHVVASLSRLSRDPWLEADAPHPVSAAASTNSLVDDVGKLFRNLRDEGVVVRDVRKLEEYLLRFPGILNVLREAVRAVKKHIPEAKLLLSLYQDPEIEDQYPVLCVRSRTYEGDFMERLEAAEDEFINHLLELEGWFQLTTDFGDPNTDELEEIGGF